MRRTAGGARAEARLHARLRLSRLRASTTRGSSSLNARGAAEKGARIRTAHALRRRAARRRPVARHAARRQRDVRSAGARIVNAAGPWVRSVLDRRTTRIRTPGAIRHVKGSHIVVPARARPRARVHPAEPRQAHRLRDSVPGALHADRHHRRARSPIPTSRHDLATTRPTISAPRPTATVAAAHARRRRVDLERRAAALRRRLRRPVRGHARLRSSWLDAGRPRAACCRSTAARSRPIASSPRTRSSELAPCFPDAPAVDATRAAARRRLRRAEASTRSSRRYRARYPKLDPRRLERLVAPARARDRRGSRRRPRAGRPRRVVRRRLTAREIDYLVEREWAREPDDVLWRRTKCGLHMSAAERERVGESCRLRHEASVHARRWARPRSPDSAMTARRIASRRRSAACSPTSTTRSRRAGELTAEAYAALERLRDAGLSSSCRSPAGPPAGATTSRACGRSTASSARTARSTCATTRAAASCCSASRDDEPTRRRQSRAARRHRRAHPARGARQRRSPPTSPTARPTSRSTSARTCRRSPTRAIDRIVAIMESRGPDREGQLDPRQRLVRRLRQARR